MRPICAMDTETTSLAWNREAWEVALIRRDDDGVKETSFFIDVDLNRADPKSLEIGGYYRRHPHGIWSTDLAAKDANMIDSPAPNGLTYLWADHAARVVQRWTHEATIVGAQPHFDTHIFERMLRKYERQPSWHYRLRDVESMTAGALGEDVGGLAKCAAALGVPFPDADQHTALGDARVALAIYDHLMSGDDE